MADYKKLVEALRLCQFGECGCGKCFYKELKGDWCTEDNHPEFFDCDDKLKLDAATAIEDLEGFLSEAERDRDEYEERMRKEQERVIELQAEEDALAHDIKRYVEINAELTTEIEALQAEVGQWKAAVKGQEDGIKVLQAEVERLKDSNEELREKQTYIDHYGAEWMTSAKDVPTAAYEHGYADGRDEAEAQLPKRGKWIYHPEWANDGECCYECSVCGMGSDVDHNFCMRCGADMRKMEVQDGEN